MKNVDGKNGLMICPECRYVGNSERFSSGNYLLEMFLWSLLFVPGAFYTTWRFFNEYRACPKCMNRTMAPLDSSFGKKILEEKERMDAPISKDVAFSFLKNLFRG